MLLSLSVMVGRGPDFGATTFADHAIHGLGPADGQVREVGEPAGDSLSLTVSIVTGACSKSGSHWTVTGGFMKARARGAAWPCGNNEKRYLAVTVA
jgi:hypothetical protein